MTVQLGHEESYYSQRHIHLDQRGTLIIDPDSQWGFNVKTVTLFHQVEDWGAGGYTIPTVDRPVIVEKHTWIGTYAMLYNCIIREGAIVTLGACVRSCEVAPWTMVAGNPARVIARWHDGKWNYIDGYSKWTVLA